MNKFDYSAPTELFRHKTKGKGASFYRRFDSAAAAISFAVERFDKLDLMVTILEVDEERVDGRAIRALYDSADYPLARNRAALLDK